ncbi:MAG: hypothetical protein Fur0032_06890 [Terrimicrobiaceae bacterium]
MEPVDFSHFMQLRSPSFHPFVLALGAILFCSDARALVINGFNNATDSRFISDTTYESWISTAPANTSFDLGAFDFSGVGWRYNSSDATASKQGIALVSSQYALTAWHVAPSITESVRFRNTSGIVKTYGIDSVTRIGATDLALIRLNNPIPLADSINRLPVLNLQSSWLGTDVILYGRGSPGNNTSPRTGTGTVQNVAEQTVSGSTGLTLQTRYVTASAPIGEAYFQTGDSGSPMLAVSSGVLTLGGINWAVASGTGYYDSIATLVANYASSINAVLATDGQSLSVVPEPRTAVLMLLAGLLIFFLHRLRLCKNSQPSKR